MDITNNELSEESRMWAVKAAMTFIVTNTKYSMKQVSGVLALADKWGDKAVSHMSVKQKKIYEMFVELLGGLFE